MKKRAMLCAALLICLAATAFAGGAQEKETPEYFRKPGGESVTDTYVYGENMPGVYTYGGSRRDWINAMAAAPDGRIAITGYTESSDGTLSDRTKTWRAGWVMMLDKDMNVMWNFCSRSGDADHMRYPVFQENGMLTVAHHTEEKQIKIVWIDEHGEEFSSNTVLSGESRLAVKGVCESGYLMAYSVSGGDKQSYTLYDWNGSQIFAYGNGMQFDVVAQKHLIAQDKSGLWLAALEKDGTRREIVRLSRLNEEGNPDRQYHSVISLEDGGAAACGTSGEGQDKKGLISRWDAQGNLVFEMIVLLGELRQMVKTETGFAATCARLDDRGAPSGWLLLEFDENGILCRSHDLYASDSLSAGGILGQTTDGRLICAQTVGEHDQEDVFVTVVKTE